MKKKKPSLEDIQLGTLLRIADAVEKMAGNYGKLIEERTKYKCLYEDALSQNDKQSKANSALRGVITKLKKVRR